MNKNLLGNIMAIGAIICSASYPIFGKILLENLSPETLLGVSQTFSVLLVLLFFGFLTEIKKIKHLSKTEIIVMVLVSIFSGVIGPLLLLKGIEISSAINATLISKLDSVFIGILAIVFIGEKLSIKQIIGAMLMFFGVIYISTQGLSVMPSVSGGEAILLLSAFCYACGNILFKKYLHHIPVELLVIFRNTIGAIFMFTLIPFLFNMTHSIENEINHVFIITLSLFAVITIVLTQILWYKALDIIPASRLSILNITGPFFGILMAVIFLGEQFTPTHFIGALFMIFGLILTILHIKEHTHHHIWRKLKIWKH